MVGGMHGWRDQASPRTSIGAKNIIVFMAIYNIAWKNSSVEFCLIDNSDLWV